MYDTGGGRSGNCFHRMLCERKFMTAEDLRSVVFLIEDLFIVRFICRWFFSFVFYDTVFLKLFNTSILVKYESLHILF